MAKYDIRGSMDVSKKKSSIGTWVNGVFWVVVILMIIGAVAE